MADMPEGTLYGTIVGSLSAFFGDTASDTNDLPDRVPAAGVVTFEPSIQYVNYIGSDPSQDQTIFATPEPVKTDSQGRISVKLVATDSPVLNPRDWYYTVRVQVPGRPTLVTKIAVPGGQTTSLTRAVGAAQPGAALAVVEGKPGRDGHTPVISWNGTTMLVDGVPGPDLGVTTSKVADVTTAYDTTMVNAPISGDTTVTVPDGGATYAINLADDATLTLATNRPGVTVVLDVVISGHTLAIAGGAKIATDGVYAFIFSRGVWKGGASSGGAAVITPDTTPPSAPTVAISSATQSSVTLAVSGSVDDVKVTKARWSIDSGATWAPVALPEGAGNITADGLTGATRYTFLVQTGDAAGNWSSSTTVTTSTKTAPYADTVLSHSPSIYLPFDDAAGSSAAENLGGDGGVVPVTAFTFGAPGIGDKNTCATTTAQSTTGQMSTNYANGGTWEMIVKVSAAPGVDADFLWFAGGKMRMYSDGGIATYFGGQFIGQGGNGYPTAVGKPHHVAFTYAADGTQRFYVDGSLVGTASAAIAPSATFLGVLPGSIAGFAFTPSVLTPAQIKADAKASGVTS